MKDLLPYPSGEQNVKVEWEKMEKRIIGDHYAMRIGYVEKAMQVGDKLWIKPSDAQHLYALLRREFE